MHNNQALQNLKQLRLYGMLKALENQLDNPNTYNDLPFVDRITMLLEHESQYRSNNKFQRLVKAAKFKLPAVLNNLDYSPTRGISKSIISSYMSFDWLKSHQNILITGSTGCGKTYLACALGHSACVNGYSVRYYRASRLFDALTTSHGDGSFSKLLHSIAKIDLLIIDDWGLEPLTNSSRNDLLEVMEDRHNTKSTIITSQLPTNTWHEIIGDLTLADAIMDRFLHNAHKINLKGESMRKIKSNLTQFENLK